MTLTTDFQAAFSAQASLALSNPDAVEATTDDATRIGLAADDAEGYFEIYVGKRYDGTDKRHKALGIEGVQLILKMRAGRPTAAQPDLNAWIERLERLGKQTARATFDPITNSNLVPSIEEPTRPVFDRGSMGDMLLRQPRTTSPSVRSFD